MASANVATAARTNRVFLLRAISFMLLISLPSFFEMSKLFDTKFSAPNLNCHASQNAASQAFVYFAPLNPARESSTSIRAIQFRVAILQVLSQKLLRGCAQFPEAQVRVRPAHWPRRYHRNVLPFGDRAD